MAKKQYVKSIDYFDIIIPLIFLNLAQYENLIWGITINLVFPTFFLFLSIYLFNKKETLFRNHILLLVAVLSVNSALHGLVVCCVILLFFLWYLIRDLQKRKQSWKSYAGFSVAICIIIGSYFIGLYPSPYLGPKNSSISYVLQFIALQINSATGTNLTNVLMWILPFGSLAYFLFWLICWIRKHRINTQSFTIFSLFMYSFVFLLLTVFGRGGLGVDQGTTSRYVSCMSPLFFAMYLVGRSYGKGWMKIVNIAVYGWFILLSLVYRSENIRLAQQWFYKTEVWKTCYLKIKDYKQCNTIANLHEDNPEAVEANIESLKKLETYRLNMFYP